MSPSEDVLFACPDCGETVQVNPAMRDALVENGCVVCGSPVPEDAFDTDDSNPE